MIRSSPYHKRLPVICDVVRVWRRGGYTKKYLAAADLVERGHCANAGGGFSMAS